MRRSEATGGAGNMAARGIEWTKMHWRTALILIAAAAALTVGLEMTLQRTMPPVFADQEMKLVGITEDQLQAAGTYLHASGRIAYRETWDLLRLIVIFAMQTAILWTVFPLGLGKRFLAALRKAWNGIREALKDKKAFWIRTGIFLGVTAAGFLLFRIWAADTIRKSNWMVDMFALGAGAALALLLTFRKTLGKKPEIIFVCLTLLMGGQMAFLFPDDANVTWDNAFHYQHAVNYSMMGHVRFTEADLLAMKPESYMEKSLEKRAEFIAQQDENVRNGAKYVTGGCHLMLREWWMAFNGLGLFLGRVLHLNYWMTWSLGRLTGLIAYVILGYFAIRRLRSGKMIAAAVLMIPQQIFQAANYTYDPGVTAFVVLGCAYFFAQWQEGDRKISGKDQTIMIASFFLGCQAKLIYFPVALIPLLLPKEKFASPRARRRFNITVICSVALMILMFALPFVMGDGAGDDRGGEGVNAFGQVQYILTHPLEYASTLIHFLGRYLHPNEAYGFLTFFAYFGGTRDEVIYLIVMAAAAFLDRDETDEGLGREIGRRAVIEFTLLTTLVLVATSLYISFTEVGSNSIAGCQPRYLTPLIFPAMMALTSSRIRNKMNPALYHGLIFAGAGFCCFSVFLRTCVAYFH